MEDQRERSPGLPAKSGNQVLYSWVRVVGEQFEPWPDDGPEVLLFDEVWRAIRPSFDELLKPLPNKTYGPQSRDRFNRFNRKNNR